jgi:uncharacterized protein with FMN-binding domain
LISGETTIKKKRIRIIIAVVVVVLLAIWGAMAYMQSNLKQLSDLTIAKVDLSKIDDGIYAGSYKSFPVAAEVLVTISSHRIAGIDLVKHSNGQGSGAEIIPGQVVEAQSLEVDIVSGATYSSKVILKAIEDALMNTN